MRALSTERTLLEPLVADHADAMYPLLADAALYRFLDDAPPPSAAVLRQGYRKLESRASPDGHQHWLNWAIRLREGGAIAGYVQATVLADGRAWIAFVLGSAWQGHGLALETTQAMLDELRARYAVRTLLATADAGNAASIRLLQRLGLREEADSRARAALGVARGDVLYVGRA